MNIPITATIPDLWGNQTFSKSEWGTINYLVGPNGSGKTRFAENIKQALSRLGMKPRYLNAERLAGLERTPVMGRAGAFHQGFDVGQYQNYRNFGEQQGYSADAFVILKEKMNVRIRIEAFLSSIFGRRIRFAEEGGFLKPKLQKIRGGSEYEMKEGECHGLKELITLLAFLYDDPFNALIIDEPELHLHPQFQTFLLSEIRRLSGDPRTQPGAKVFFLITHSPYLLDFRILDDLRQCLIFHPNEVPSCIESLSPQDEHVLKRLLPRLNTHHKQFFFAQRPIFVEGYTDQQLFTLIQDSRAKLLGASGACFIDVNGKDEQDFFFRLCKNLKIEAQFISDLDVITRGNLRNSISEDSRCSAVVVQRGLGTNLMDGIRDLCIKLDSIIRAIDLSSDPQLLEIKTTIAQASETESKRYKILIAAIHRKNLLITSLASIAPEIEYVVAKVEQLAQAAVAAGVFLLPKGALENHLASYTGSVFQVPDRVKATTFEAERDFILSEPGLAAIESRYSSLIPILDEAAGACGVNLRQHLAYAVAGFIVNVQSGFERAEITSVDSLKQHALVDWPTYSQILDVVSFDAESGSFSCRVRLKQLADPEQTEFEFTDTTIHSKFSL